MMTALMVGTATLSMVAAAVAPASAQAASANYRIASQPLGQALMQLSRQANVDIVAPARLTRGRTAGAVAAESVDAALRQMLAGTGLSYKANGRRYVIQAGSGSSAGAMQASPASNDGESKKSSSSGEGAGAGAAAGNQGADQQEIVVTAQKREEAIRNVPISIVALSAEELKRRRLTSVDDLTAAVPGLAIQSSGTWQRRIVLRGLSNFFGSTSPLIGMYMDEAPLVSRSDMQPYVGIYDLARIEVLRGPQGTLYGDGSVGGTIRFITRAPVLNQLETDGSFSTSFTQNGGPSEQFEGVLNVPVVSDVMGFRIAGIAQHNGGWIDQPAIARNNINSEDLIDLRARGRLVPTSRLTLDATAVVHRNEGAPNIGEDDQGNFRQAFNQPTTPNVKDKYNLYNLTARYEFPSVELLSATTYLNQDKHVSHLGSRTPTAPPPSTVFRDFYTSQFFDAHIFTQEVRLTSTGSSRLRWTLGTFYRHYKVSSGSPGETFSGIPGPPGSPLPAPSTFGSIEDNDSWAGFGDASYQLTDRLRLGSGLRYFWEKRKFNNGIFGRGVDQRGTFKTLNPRIYALFEASKQVNLYASAAKGFRSGGFNLLGQPPFDPEKVWSYEVGAKTSFLDGKLRADLTAFYSDYKGYQVTGAVPLPPTNLLVAITSNAGSARVKGIEWSLFFQPSKSWQFSLSGDYIDSEFYRINAAAASYKVGDPLDLTPPYSFTASVQHDFDWAGRPGYVRLDYSQAGRATFRNRRLGDWFFSQSDVIHMLNFNSSLQLSPNLALGLFGQNLLNDRGYTNAWVIQGQGSRSRPRTFGVRLDVGY